MLFDKNDDKKIITYEDVAEKPTYTTGVWAGVLEVYVCEHCGTNMDSEGDMQIHVLTHYPDDEKDDLLDEMLGG